MPLHVCPLEQHVLLANEESSVCFQLRENSHQLNNDFTFRSTCLAVQGRIYAVKTTPCTDVVVWYPTPFGLRCGSVSVHGAY